jgi:hypothetical protein
MSTNLKLRANKFGECFAIQFRTKIYPTSVFVTLRTHIEDVKEKDAHDSHPRRLKHGMKNGFT